MDKDYKSTLSVGPWENDQHSKGKLNTVPLGARLLSYIGVFKLFPTKSYRLYILILTFICYASYHMSRKPFSVVSSVLAPGCKHHHSGGGGGENESDFEDFLFLSNNSNAGNESCEYIDGWPPFNGSYCKTVIGAVDYAWLFTYAIFMIASGFIADRVNLRYFLTAGMMGCGILVGLLGVSYFAGIHFLPFFIIVQVFVGMFESTGWPATVAVMGNWFGKKNRGLLMGIWNAHTSVGNILGTAVPSIWAKPCHEWGWSFLVPAFVMIFVGLLMFFFLVLDPKDVGLPPPEHHQDQAKKEPTIKPLNDPKTNEIKDESELSDEEHRPLLGSIQDVDKKPKAISLWRAALIPGVIEFALSLFFAKMVAYTFLFWLPYYVRYHTIGGRYVGDQKADLLATLYDVGGIVGGITTGALSDVINARAISCVIMMYLAVPTLFAYRFAGGISLGTSIALILFCGLFINGPYALITTAVSGDLGTHKSLKDNQKAKATVTAIIDGTGSLGAALGPLVTGFISDQFGWDSAFYVLMGSCFISSLNVLAPNCNDIFEELNESSLEYEYGCNYNEGWAPFNGSYCKTVIGAVDYAWLFTYAIFMIASGLIADRVNLRYFLTVGMIGSGVFVGMLGVAYFADIHHLAYYIVIQIFVGVFESTGWPGVVAVMGNWFGKKNRGLLMGIWNSHTSVGNILGTAIPSLFAKKCDPWGWAFLIPGFVMIFVGCVMFFFLVLDPHHVGLPPPQHHEIKEPRPQKNGMSYKKESDLTADTNIKTSGKLSIENDTDENAPLIGKSPSDTEKSKGKAVGLLRALTVPGVVEFAVSLFFAKMVAYTFLFWLPYYVAYNRIGGRYIGEQKADLLATLYDVGGIIGGITTGALSDVINARAISCVIMLYCAVPTLFMYRYFGVKSVGASIALIIFCGLFINGPYALITTAVSSDLGTHESLRENQKAKATVTAIIDGMGSLGAAFGPLVTGFVSDYFGWNSAFYVLMGSCFISSLMLSRLVVGEARYFYRKFKTQTKNQVYAPTKASKESTMM
uniref:Major facilitator superfamily (MFS) profile domain-containing protein n=1 Tax=Amphimedon queenslandica TaxID=400682 RepID=A0A1X7UQD1_AMPQE